MQISRTSSKNDVGNRGLLLINLIGFLLSAYAYHVSISKKAQPNYQAFCDISEMMSCSKVLTSRYSTGFGIMKYLVDESSTMNATNSAVGIFYYLAFTLLSFSNNLFLCKFQLALAVISNLGSIYLAVILVVLRDICVVCISTYVINALNYLFLSQKLKLLKKQYSKIKKS